jgi:hypothetical protein
MKVYYWDTPKSVQRWVLIGEWGGINTRFEDKWGVSITMDYLFTIETIDE